MGKDNFSGKLSASWPNDLDDYPISDSYSYLDNNVDKEEYKEGIYVGYRYFDSFNVNPLFSFGYGLSYTNFKIETSATIQETTITINTNVTNICDKEVI